MLESNDSQIFLDSVKVQIPQSAIAQHPLANRSDSKLLVRELDGKIHHDLFRNIGNWLKNKNLLVVNQTKVFPSRFFAKGEGDKKIEVFLLNQVTEAADGFCYAKALARPLAKISVGQELDFSADLKAKVLKKQGNWIEIGFEKPLSFLLDQIDQIGATPLPPYIKRKEGPINDDKIRYQCVYAQNSGSVAAPTAGLHFDEIVVKKLTEMGIDIARLTLHVGAGTFMPIKSHDISQHKMHSEAFHIAEDQMAKILAAKEANTGIIAVGSTSFRALESLYLMSKKNQTSMNALADKWHSTDLYIYPKTRKDRYQNYFADSIITNFHQPSSSLYFLISALVGFSETEKMYEEAIENHYRFFSYGDASLLALR